MIFSNYEKYIIEFFEKQKANNLFEIGRGENKKTYNFVPMGFDIETYTQYTKDSKGKVVSHFTNMYIWQFSFNDVVFGGRTWEEFHELLELIKKHITRGKYHTFIFIHNCNFEFSFFRNIVEYHDIKVFARTKRHPMKITIDEYIVFLDSYLLTGFSLKKLAENYTTTQKLPGDEFGYMIARNRFTELSPEELAYCENDVLILSEYAVFYKDNYLENGFFPMTSTMIANQVMKDKIKELKCHKEVSYLMKEIYPSTINQYSHIMGFFTGAYTHGMSKNLFITHNDCLGYDVTSEYPYCLFLEYPISKFKVLHDLSLVDKFLKTHCCLLTVTFKNIRTKTGVTIISKHKANNIVNASWDNGRLYSADSVSVKITNIDLETFSFHLEWEKMEIENFIYAKKGNLPDYILLTIAELYSKKCKLKGVEGMEIEYMQSKRNLNGIYGSLCTKESLSEIVYNDKGLWEELPKEIDFSNKWKTKNKAPQFACFCTSHARNLILRTIAKIKPEHFFYCDTDSIKCKNEEYIVKMFEETNSEIMKNNQKWIDRLNLKEKYPDIDFSILGTFDFEGKIDKLKVLGSKRYLTETNGKLNCTVAGLPRGTFEKYVKDNNLEPFETFTNHLFFNDMLSEKLGSYYCDEPKEFEVIDTQGNKEIVHSESYVSLIPTTFKMDIDEMLIDLFNNINQENNLFFSKDLNEIMKG